MKNELDIVDTLLGNEDVADCHKPRAAKKKAIRAGLDNDTPPDDYVALEPHTKHMDPEVKGRDAKEQAKDKPHWIGDCHKLSKDEKESSGLPDDAYLVVKCVGGPNASACVYDPVHWMYGWGENTVEAVKDCLKNVREWRAEFPSQIPDLIKNWEERLVKHSHPFTFNKEATNSSKIYQSKHLEGKTTTDILKAIGL